MPPALDWSPAIRHLCTVDRKLAPVIERHGAPTIEPTTDAVRSLARAIVSQQLSGKAASTIWNRVLALYPGSRFPRAQAILATSEDALRGAGLSGAKAAALKDLARHVVEKKLVPSRLAKASDDEVAAMLLPVRGIGPWSVDMFLMFALARPDVLPVGDLGIRKGMQRHFGLRKLPEAEKMMRLAAPWQPFRSVAAWYMWRLLET
ncbi:MAG TPA: DNA-3-methyladenine glycosylase 2 family protein [Kofleriaceae bacterium]|nr:DNA-3-methyladenine glycosylase 2 family protein [Kofleriaceae bacterium]